MKRIISILLVILMCLSVVSCSSNRVDDEDAYVSDEMGNDNDTISENEDNSDAINQALDNVKEAIDNIDIEISFDSNSSTNSTSKDSSSSSKDSSGWYQDGMYKVGVDIPAGDYYIENIYEDYSTYFAISSDSSGDSILENENFYGHHYVTLRNGEYFELSRGRMKTVENVKLNINANDLKVGMYRVGEDIPAGEYKLVKTQGNFGYFATYDNATGERDIEENENFKDSYYITVTKGTYLYLERCKASLVNETSSSQGHVHNFINSVCLDCGEIDKDAIKITLPDESKIYSVHYDDSDLYIASSPFEVDAKYQIKDISYAVYRIQPAALRLDVKFKIVPLGSKQIVGYNDKVNDIENVAFYYDWAYLTDSNGFLDTASNSVDEDYHTNSITARVNKDNEVTLRFEYIEAGTYTLGFLEGEYGDYLRKLTENFDKQIAEKD